MKKIGITNYEEWAMDYLEGTLPAGIRASFEQFLSQHPEIARELRELGEELPVLPVEEVVYPGKRDLLRGRKIALRRLGSFFSGAVAASVLVGIFVSVNMYLKQDDRTIGPLAMTTVPALLPAADSSKEEAEAPLAEIVSEKPVLIAAAVPAEKTEPGKDRKAERIAAKSSVPVTGQPAGSAPAARPAVLSNPPAVKTAVSDLPAEARTEGRRELFLEAQPVIASAEGPSLRPHASFKNMETPSELAGGVLMASDGSRERHRSRFGEVLRQSVGSMLIPIDMINPIKIYRTNDGGGVEIASLIRIGTNDKN